MYYEWIQRNKLKTVGLILSFFGLIIVWAAWTYFDRTGKIPLTISVVPSNATVLVNGKSLGNGTHWLAGGNYTIKAEKEGFASQSASVQVTANKTQNVAAFSLSPESSDAKKWADSHQADYKRNEQFGAIQARNDGKYFSDKNPITTKLPFNDPYFTIGYRVNKDNSIVLTVETPSPRYRFYAIEKIRLMGYDPTDFTIEFRDFKNPLEVQ